MLFFGESINMLILYFKKLPGVVEKGHMPGLIVTESDILGNSCKRKHNAYNNHLVVTQSLLSFLLQKYLLD
jgi:hypothetical protein